MKKSFLISLMIALLAAITIAGASGSASAATCNGTFTGLTPNLANGQSLVAQNSNCNSCHGAPSGTTASTIYSFASHMSFMSTWTCQNFVDAAAALGAPTPTPAPTPAPGATPTPVPVPTPGPGAVSIPTSQEVFVYDAVADPVVSSDPSQSRPIGIGSVANGGDVLDVSVNIGPFSGLVDVSLSEYVQADNTGIVYSMSSMPSGDNMNPSSGNAVWKAGVTGLNQHVFGPISTSQLQKGVYVLTLTATTSGSEGSGNGSGYYYQWTTYFVVGGTSTTNTVTTPSPVTSAPVTPAPMTPPPAASAPAAPAAPVWVAPPTDNMNSGV